MLYETGKNRITVFPSEDFDIRRILECGQVFRYRKTGDVYEVFAGREHAAARNSGGKTEIECTDEKYFVKYFDLNRNYGIIRLKLRDKGLVRAALDFGKGLRILRQEPFETLVSFIVSQNNRISRIKDTVERLCSALGEDAGGYRAFPSPAAMAAADEDFYRSIGTGYRAPYLVKTARLVAEGADLDSPGFLPADEARERLCAFPGVGPKVADCVLLFGYGRTEVFPADTWIVKACDRYWGKETNPVKVSRKLAATFGELSGYAQQYLFDYMRNCDDQDDKETTSQTTEDYL